MKSATIRTSTLLAVILTGSFTVAGCGGGGSSTAAPPNIQDDVTGESTNGSSGGSTNGSTGDSTSGTTSDSTGGTTGGTTSDSTGGTTSDSTGGTTGGTTSDSTGGTTGGTTSGTTGGSTTGGSGGSTVGSTSGEITDNPAVDRSEAIIVFAENAAAPDRNGEVLSRFTDNSLRVNSDGSFALIGTFSFTGGATLWGGSIFDPKVMLKSGEQLAGFPANMRLGTIGTPYLGPAGDIATVVTLSGADDAQAVVRIGDAGSVVIARSDEPASTANQRINLLNMRAVSVVADQVGFIAGSNRPRLWIHDGTELKAISTSVLSDALLQPDGCRFLFAGSSRDTPDYALGSDGSVVFEATVTIESGGSNNPAICPDRNKVIQDSTFQRDRLVGDRFSSVVRYDSAGLYTRVVSRGDEVPGMIDTFFTSVELRGLLADNSMVIQATMGTKDRSGSATSIWLFKSDGTARLIVSEGEQFDSSEGSATLVLDDIRGDVRFSSNGTVGALFTKDIFRINATTWLLAGQPHIGQPHASLDSIGSGSLSPFAFQGGSSPDDFPESMFFGPISNVAPLDNGSGYFTAQVVDVDDSTESLAAIWKYDSNGLISSVLTDRQGVVIDGLPNLFTGLPDQYTTTPVFTIGNDAIVFIESANGVRSKIVYLPIER